MSPHNSLARGSLELAALALSLMPGLMGINALVRPGPMLDSVNFPTPADPAARGVNHSLMRFFGARNVVVSYLLVLIWQQGDHALMAKSLAACMAMAAADGYITRAQTGGGHWNSWAVVPVLGGVAAGLGYYG